MKSFKQYITELFDKPYKWKVSYGHRLTRDDVITSGPGPRQISYEFTTDDNEVTKNCLAYMLYSQDADFDCPSKDIDTCKELKACHENIEDFGLDVTCFKKMYDVGLDDDMEDIFVNLFDYEEGVMSSDKWADYVADELKDLEEDERTYGVATYGTDSLTVDVADRYIITADTPYTWITSPSFICGNGDEIPFDSVNDGNEYSWDDYCEDGADEQWYDNYTETDYTDDCQQWNTANCTGAPVNWLDCHDGSKVWIYQVNDNNRDCPDGEDEYYDEIIRWYADIYLYEGSFNPENTDNLIAASSYACDWEDSSDHSLGVYCGDNINIDLEVGDYTLVTASRCPMMWDEET